MSLKEQYDWFLSKLTIFKWLSEYSSETFKKDLFAGVTVGVMLIPQGMAYAVLAGVPAIYGLYASLVPLLIYPLFGTSRHLAVGVVAIDMLVVAAGVGLIAEPGTPQYISLVILLSVFVGITQIAMSVARLGFIVNLLSKPVIIGFTTAAPLIISFSQLGNLTGIEITQSQYIYDIVMELTFVWDDLHLLTFGIGIGGIVLLVLSRRIAPFAPEALLLVIISSVLVWGLGLAKEGVEVVGYIERGLPAPTIPSFSFEELRRLVPTILTLALVQFMNVVTLGRTFATKHKYAISPNRELMALGTANLLGGFFRSLPISGSFSRSAVNEQAGAKTPLTNIFAAISIGLTLLFLTPLFYFVPMPALSAIIIVASLGLIEIEQIRYLFRTKERDGYIALFTFVTILLIGIQEGILLGVGASLIGVLVQASRPNVAELGHITGSHFFRDISRYPEADRIQGLLVLRVDASFSFHNAEYFKEYIISKSEEENRRIEAVIIEGRSINDLDTTAIEALQNVVESLQEINIDLHFAGLKGPVRDIMLRSGLARRLGGAHFHMTTHQAVQYILEKWQKKNSSDHRFSDYMDTVD
ncbi:sulfate permease [Aliifodinibius sp. S!AR15-10]|uniref:SulP family inorganic anion transporter n=1 Tax=Aliifodinibius sp. S!AR15-10 TaxID=2950437 RepID=UPI002855115E|nr:sulfate permease [Aliifodinibius sp. S!AR15-10]MDR8391605.1 sulfate permease [Aliifodinibius sp. S!AR15-10]